ncbi:MAG: TonB-dependent receptor [Proteobacteria bacterium]|nr:TonB-dependent receptor [Pseudomonadota bacterium]
MGLAMLGLPPIVAASGPRASDTHVLHIDIRATALSGALRELARQCALQIARFSDDARDLAVGPLSGELTCTQALDRLLAGTGLAYRFLNDQTVAITQAGDSTAAKPPADTRATPDVSSTSPGIQAGQNSNRGEETMIHRGLLARLGAFFGFCTAAAGLACAQNAPTESAEPTTGLAEIIVTAQKRAESVQDVPIAITAISGADLAKLGIVESRSIEAAVPNMRWIANQGTNVSNVFIRGVGDISFHLNQVGAVGLYMDEISLNSPILSTFGMFDLQRVEVLRGPQNTIFGRNTTGGAVQFVSQKPVMDELSGRGAISAGNFGRFDVDGAINLPAGEHAAIRLALARFSLGNYLNNAFLDKQQGAYHRDAGRAQLLWKPTDSLDVLLNIHAGQSKGGFTGYKQIGLGTPADPAAVQCPANLKKAVPGNGCVDQTGFADSGNFSQVWDNGVDVLESKVRGASARLDWRLSAFTVTSLTAYEHSDGRRMEDSNGSPNYIFDFTQSSNANQWSEELRAASREDSAMRWIGGVYYFHESGHWTTLPYRANQALTNVTVPGQPVPATDWFAFIPFTDTHQKDEVYSGYGQLEFKLSERFRLTTGLRFTSEKKSGMVSNGIVTRTDAPVSPFQFVDANLLDSLLVGATEVPAGSALRLACPKPLPFTKCVAYTPFDIQNNELGGKVSLDYRVSSNTLTYLSASRGFKAGGISLGALDYVARGGSQVTPEYLWTFELGGKTELFDRTLRINAALFDNRWTNQQLFLVLNTPGTGANPVYTNVPKTASYGFEAEIDWAPTPDWYLKNSVGLLHSKVEEIGPELAASQGAVVGSQLIASPKVTWNGTLRRQWQAGPGRISLEGNWSYTGAQHFDLLNSPDQIEDSYWLFNASTGYQFGAKQQFEVSLWGKNLTGTQYCVQHINMSGVVFGNVAACVPNEARRFFGIALRGSF